MRTLVLLVLFMGLCSARVPQDRHVVQNQTEDSTVSERSGSCICCDGICDLDRYNEYTAGLLGYNIFYGEPYFIYNDIDPGNRRQIFNPAVEKNDGTGRMELNGITKYDIKSCGSQLHSKVITTTEEARNIMLNTVTSNSNVGFKSKAEVKVGLSKGPAKGEVSTTIENTASLAFSKSDTMKEISKYLSNSQHAMTMQDITCTTERLEINKLSMPTFTDGFVEALILLNGAKGKFEKQKRFKIFVEEYGTHYMSAVTLGAKLTYTRFLKTKARQDFNSKNLNKCSSYSFALKYFSAEASNTQSKCSKNTTEKLTQNTEFVGNVLYRSRGSGLPDKIENWAQLKLTPVPLTMELKPIAELFEDTALKNQNALKGLNPPFNGKRLIKWFKHMMSQYCYVFGLNCIIHKGCGDTDDCGFNQFCVDKEVTNGKSYECKDIPVKFSATAIATEEQFFVSWSIPSERFQNGLTFNVKYRLASSSGAWTYGVRSTKDTQFITNMQTSTTDHGSYVFRVEAYNKTGLFKAVETKPSKRELVRANKGGRCETNIQCSNAIGTACAGGRCECSSGSYDRITYCISETKLNEELNLQGSDTWSSSLKGDWGSWKNCPINEYVYGYQMRSLHHRGSGKDDYALSNLRLFCRTYGSAEKSTTLDSSNGHIKDKWGYWKDHADCPGTEPAIGFQIRIFKGVTNDEVGATDLRLFCKSGKTITAEAYPGSRVWGDWSKSYRCPDGYAVAGFNTRVQPATGSGVDDTGLNGVKMICRKYEKGECESHSQCSISHAVCINGNCQCQSDYYERPKYENPEYCISGSTLKEETYLEGGDTWETEGDWGSWENCPINEYVYGYQMRSLKKRGSGKDDYGLSNLRLFCRTYGSVEKSTTLDSSNGITLDTWGYWKGAADCNGTEQVIGFEIRIFRGESNDRVGATDLRLLCKSGLTITAEAYPGSRVWGTWSKVYRCPDGYAVAGFNTKVLPAAGSGVDDVGLNGVKMICRKYDM